MSTNHERARARLAGDQFKSVLTLLFLSWPGAVTSRTVDLTPAVPGSPARCCPREAAQLIRGMPLLSRTCTSRSLLIV
jgi:hypothetical protein